MLVDLHAHYPMHLQPRRRQLAHEHLRQWEKEWLRAHIVRWLSRDYNYQGPSGGPGVTVEEMEAGAVGVILSPLYEPFDEIDFARRYGAKPRPSYFTELLDQLALVESDIKEHRNAGRGVTIAHSPSELSDALRAGEQVVIHAVEGGFHLGHDEHEVRENVRRLAELGVAYITVAHLFWRGLATNAPALPFMPDWLYSLLFPQPQHFGLSSLGRAAVNAMVDYGVLVDITHMSEQAAIDTLDLLDERDPTRRVPVIATHMACRLEGVEWEYNLPDTVIARVAERKGLLGLIACERYISGDAKGAPADFDASFASICRHIDHIVDVTRGDDCVAFGSDLDGYIKPALKGIERLGDMRRFQLQLMNRYGKRAEAFTSGNALRVLEAAWRTPHPRPDSRRSDAVAPAADPPASPGSTPPGSPGHPATRTRPRARGERST
jgi:microsomal dipeptidase-like Zn-dependent dipeptidase